MMVPVWHNWLLLAIFCIIIISNVVHYKSKIRGVLYIDDSTGQEEAFLQLHTTFETAVKEKYITLEVKEIHYKL